ncbi:hypothetical protein ACHAXM_010152 [Skeletonema potamos]
MDTSTTQNTKQGFRFYKSGSISPVPPSNPPHRVSSNPSLVSESGESPSFLPQQLRRTNSSTSSSSPAVDPKLLQIVKRITTSTQSLLIASTGGNKASQQARSNNIAAITNLVLDKHREYKRKDISWVRSGVEGALSVLATESAGNSISGDTNSNKKRRAPTTIPIGGGSNISSNPSTGSLEPNPSASQKKKRVESADEDTSSLMDEDNSDLDITDEKNNNPHDNNLTNSNETSIISQTNAGGMLNASLRNNYKNVQREREREAAAAAAATSADDASAAPADDATNDASSVVATPLDGNEKSSPVAQGSKTPTASVTTPKRKKKSSKKAPSSSRNHDNSDDNPYSTSTPSTLVLPSPRPTERYSNLGGMAPLLQQVRELIEYPLSRPELFLHLGVEPPRGVLLRGPPGCGKTHLAKAISGELNVSYFQVSAPELVGGVSGESELRVRTLFESAANYAPAIIFIDEIDAIAPKRGEGAGGGGKSMEKRIVAQLLTSMDSIHPQNNRNASAVIVLGATNRPDAMDPALRRAGRFDREIVLGAPDEAAREGILQVMTSQMRVEGSLDYKVLARKTPGFVGADLRSLTKEAAVIAIKRIFRMDLLGGSGDAEKHDDNLSNYTNARDTPEESSSNDINSIVPLTPEQLSPLYITMEDFLAAIPHVQPSSKREGFATVPDVSWDDIGALASIREELTLSVLEPIAHPEKFEALGLPLPAGVLLYGPPGCGKTLLAKAIANESGANFISVKGPELLDKYVGESERSVRVVFERARSSSPCIIFFDELDSLCPKRGSDSGGGGGVSERVVNQLLTEMDGLDSRRSVFVIAATNRPELIDPAMLRPGRLDKLLYVPLPSPDDRYSILQALGASIKLASDVNLHTIAHDSRANGFSGADCAALLREAGLAVLRDGILGKPTPQAGDVEEGKESTPLQITSGHFQYAFDHVLPSVSKKDQARYDKLRDRMARARTRSSAEADTVATHGACVEDSNASDVEKGV